MRVRAPRAPVRALLAAGLVLGGGVASPAPATAAACSGTSGVTVVVESTAGTSTRCAPGDPASAWAALTGSGHGVTPVQRFPGAICRIDGYPASDPCVNMPPSSAYWAFFHASRGGSWTYSQVGAASYDPAPGTVVGFRFGSGSAPSTPPPAPDAAPTPSTTSSSRTSPSSTSSSTTDAPRPRSATSTAARGSSSPSVVATTPDGSATRLTKLPATTGPTTRTATSAPAATTASSDAAEATTTTDAAVALAPTAAAAAGPGTPWPLLGGLAALLALGGAALLAKRRGAAH